MVVDFHDDAISLEAVEAASSDVIVELTRKTGIVVHVASLPTAPITTSFTRLDPAQALRHVFGASAGLAFVYGPGPIPAEVWVASATTPTSGEARAHRSATMPLPADLRDADAETRANATDRLAAVDGDRAVDTLARVLVTDPDADVRSAAATGLVRIGTPRALDAARHAVFDEAKLVRLRTVEALADQGGEPGRGILREALRDDDEEVRDAAAAGIPDAEVTDAVHQSDLRR